MPLQQHLYDGLACSVSCLSGGRGILKIKLSLWYSIVYCYNGAQRYEQFLQASQLYRALIFLDLAPYPPCVSVSSVFMVLYMYFKKFSYILLFTF